MPEVDVLLSRPTAPVAPSAAVKYPPFPELAPVPLLVPDTAGTVVALVPATGAARAEPTNAQNTVATIFTYFISTPKTM
jgi:hypothetical protein